MTRFNTKEALSGCCGLLLCLTAFTGCQGGEPEDSGGADSGGWQDTGFACQAENTVAISGDAFNFGPEGGRVEGAEISVLEQPGLSAVTDADGSYRIEGLPSGQRATLVLSHPDHYPITTGSFEPCGQDIEQVSIQAPTYELTDLMAVAAGAEADPEACQLATTVTEAGGSLYQAEPGSHGEAGATVSIQPAVEEDLGPIYFNLITATLIYPDRELEQTSEDGGVLFVNVPPGLYRLTARKGGMSFSDVLLTCQAGYLANASPPWGINVL